MKKTIIVFLYIFLTSSIYATDPEDLYLEEVVQFGGLSIQEIYDISMDWILESTISSESIIDYSDVESGTIKIDFIYMQPVNVYNILVKSVLMIKIREGRVKIVISDPFFDDQTGRGYRPVAEFGDRWIKKLEIPEHYQLTLESYSDYVLSYKEEEDW